MSLQEFTLSVSTIGGLFSPQILEIHTGFLCFWCENHSLPAKYPAQILVKTRPNNNGQVYTQSFVYDMIQGVITSYNKEEYANALGEKRQPCYLPKISAHILWHTFCTRMCENNINIKVLQDVMGHRNIRTTMDTYTKAARDKKIEVMREIDGAFKIS